MKTKEEFNLIDKIRQYFQLYPYVPIIEWCEKYIDYSADISAQRNKINFQQYPYQKAVIEELEMKKGVIKNVVFVAPEQTGKTNVFICGMLHNWEYAPGQSLIVYPSEELAIATNFTKIVPLLRKIPSFKEQIERPLSMTRNSYKFSNVISFFQGSGSRIISRSCNLVIGDQVDSWVKSDTIDNVSQLKKRTRSFNESVCFLISTPTEEDGNIWKEFLKSSQAYYYLRCKGCGELTMRSCDIHNLQFESELNQQTNSRIVKPETIRLICPKCKHQHVEADKKWMIQNGDYIHTIPERKAYYPGFQCGALVSQLPSLSWEKIAQEQLEAGKRVDPAIHKRFDNSFRGLPYHKREIVKEDLQRLRDHEWKVNQAPKQEQIEFVFCTIDTQDDRSVVCVWAYDVNDNLFLIKTGEPIYLQLDEDEREMINKENKEAAQRQRLQFQPLETVEDIINAEYFIENGTGIKPLFSFIDIRGHRSEDIKRFIKSHFNCLGWLGSKLQSIPYEKSQTVERAFRVNSIQYQAQAIFYLYTQKKRGSQYLYFYPDIDERVITQIAACKPDYNLKNGHYPEKWTFENRIHDYFDCTKMAFFCRDFVINETDPNEKRFRFAKSPRITKVYQEKQKKVKKKPRVEGEGENKKSYFSPY